MMISALCLSQTVADLPADSLDSLSHFYTTVDQESNFPGGVQAWRKYLQKYLQINEPLKNGVPDGTYKVIVKFKVAKDGTISNVYTTTKFGYGMEEEVVRFINRCPNWEPALRYGQKVNSIRTQAISFLYATH